VIGILILVVALILHLSFHPWRFAGLPAESDPLALFLHSWPRFITRRTVLDAAANVALYAPLGVSAWLTLSSGRRRTAAAVAAMALGAVPTAAVEIGQLYTRTRISSLPDSLANVAGTAAGIALEKSLALPANGSTRAFAAAVALGAALVVYGLAPFRMAPAPAAFEWAPFRPLMESDAELVLPILLRKVFRYGALVWCLRACSLGYPPAAACAAAFAALIEVAQLHVAGHFAEVTDPLLVVLAALLPASLERANRRASPSASPPGATAAGS
jgi:VanZ family protein